MNNKFSKLIVSGLLACGIVFASPLSENFLPAQAAEMSIKDNRATADYWTGKYKDGETVLVAVPDLERLNLQIRQKNATLVDLAKYPEKVYAQTLKNKIVQIMSLGKFDGDALPKLFKGGTALTEFSYTQAKKNCAIESIPAVVETRYALTTDRVDIRLLPEEDGWFESANDTLYDLVQATALDPAEPVAVLLDSADKKYVFVESRAYAGWIKVSSLAFTDKTTWLKYAAPKDYLTVLASRKTIPHGAAYFQMGGRVPMRSPDLQKDGTWAASLPSVDANGTIVEKAVNVPNDNAVVKGTLACSANNLIRQAFRFLGEDFGWGGLGKGVDSSAFVQDVYRSVGIELPRDTSRQSLSMPRTISLNGMNREQRLAIIKKSRPSSLLFAPGYVMIYLGVDEKDEPLVIHALSSYYTFGEKTAKHYVRKIVVSDLHFTDSKKFEMIDKLTSVGSL